MMALAGSELESQLAEGLHLLGQQADRKQTESLLAFIGLLVQWNGVYNLTSVRAPADMLTVHVLDSLSILPLIDRWASAELLDVGSGAGLPGIPVAIMRPHLRIRSIDAVGKKIGFQRQVKATLKLDRFTALHSRVEALTLAEKPDLIISRAYAELSVMLASIASISTSSTRVIAMKGTRPEAEIAAVLPPWRVDDVVTIDVPFLGAQRCAVVVRRDAGEPLDG